MQLKLNWWYNDLFDKYLGQKPNTSCIWFNRMQIAMLICLIWWMVLNNCFDYILDEWRKRHFKFKKSLICQMQNIWWLDSLQVPFSIKRRKFEGIDRRTTPNQKLKIQKKYANHLDSRTSERQTLRSSIIHKICCSCQILPCPLQTGNSLHHNCTVQLYIHIDWYLKSTSFALSLSKVIWSARRGKVCCNLKKKKKK